MRGLSNASGEYNCFLNAIIQTLWHLRTFRRGLLGLDLDALQAQGAIPEDLRVLRALSQIFHAFVQEGEAVQPPLDGKPLLAKLGFNTVLLFGFSNEMK